MLVIKGDEVGEVLIRHGLCPARARKITVELEAGAVAIMTYEVILTMEDLRELGAAIQDYIVTEKLTR